MSAARCPTGSLAPRRATSESHGEKIEWVEASALEAAEAKLEAVRERLKKSDWIVCAELERIIAQEASKFPTSDLREALERIRDEPEDSFEPWHEWARDVARRALAQEAGE